MGFTQIATGISQFQQAANTRQSAKQTLMQGYANAQALKNKSESLKTTTMHNAHLARKDGQRQIAQDKARTGASNVASSGSAMMTELDLATRLEQGIRDNARQAMEQSRQMEYEGAMGIWKSNIEAKQMKRTARAGAIMGAANTWDGLTQSTKKK